MSLDSPLSPLLSSELGSPNRRSARYSQLLYSLLEMGFEAEICDIAIVHCGTQSLDEVVRFMLQEDGQWGHPYLRNH